MKDVIADWLVITSVGGLIGGGLATIGTEDFWIGGFVAIMAGVGGLGVWLGSN